MAYLTMPLNFFSSFFDRSKSLILPSAKPRDNTLVFYLFWHIAVIAMLSPFSIFSKSLTVFMVLTLKQ